MPIEITKISARGPEKKPKKPSWRLRRLKSALKAKKAALLSPPPPPPPAEPPPLKRRPEHLSPRPRRRRWNWKRVGTYAAIAVAALLLAGSIAFIGMLAWVGRELPDPDKVNLRALAQTTTIYDRTGEHVLYEIHGAQKRTVVDLVDISHYAKDATIAAEDKNFYKHRGFDLKGYVRAFLKNLLRGDLYGQGGSTITQQFIKNSMLTTEKTYTRKFKELILALEIERRFTKDQILKLYLNEIPYGSVTYGIESAAQTYFAKSAKDLTLSESAVLAAIPKATTYYSPYGTHRDELLNRSHFVIDVMLEEGMVTAEEAEEATADDVLSRIQPKLETIDAPHFVFFVREQLAESYGEATVERGGLKVTTTLDMDMQRAAEQAVADNLENLQEWGGSTASLLALDPKTGEVLAMVGSADYFNEEINGKFNPLLSRIQPGSSIKPMVYAAALEKGYTPDTVLYDVETYFQKGAKEYKPANYDGEVRGPVTAREALAGSINIPAVKMLYLVGMSRFIDFAERLGYTSFEDRSRLGLSLVLGGGEVHPIEHIAAFSAFANEGWIRPNRSILRVEDSQGKILFDGGLPGPQKRVLEAEVARQISDMLSDNAARAPFFGELNYLTLGGRPVAAKTGTTQKYRDAWTVGYTPSLVAGVWAGNATNKEMKQGAGGSAVAAPIWNAFMRTVLEDEPIESFTAPQPVQTGKPVLDGSKNAPVKVAVDSISGKLATENTPPELVEEREFNVPHSILYFVDKEDPRGPRPENPQLDPQFEYWEEGVAGWAEDQGFLIEPPPTEYDDIHLPELAPTVTVLRPLAGEVLDNRTFLTSISAAAPRGVDRIEYLLDDESLVVFDAYSPNASVTIPNRFTKGFHVLTARAYDDVGNRGETDVTINLTAEPGPLGAQWLKPYSYQSISRSWQFPFEISFRVDDPKSIRELRLLAVRADSGAEATVGTIHDPVLPTFKLRWSDPAVTGRFDLRLEAELISGDIRSESITVYVSP